MPRATLFKPKKKEDLKKNPLWQEVFMQEDSDDDGSDSDAEELQIMNMYRDTLATKGIKVTRQSGSAMINQRTVTKSSMNNDLVLPPINAHRPQTINSKAFSATKKMSVQTPNTDLNKVETKAEKQARLEAQSRREAVRTAKKETQLAAQEADRLVRRDKFSDVFEKEPHRAGRVFKSGNSPLPIKKLNK